MSFLKYFRREKKETESPYKTITEGIVRKGGVNDPPKTPPPKGHPKGQGKNIIYVKLEK